MVDLVAHLDPERVRENLAAVRARVAAACGRSGRDPRQVELIAATKYVPAGQMGALAEAGIDLVGENIVADLAEKRERWGDRFEFDFIGHLQSRKVRDLLPHVRLIHSIDSESVLRQIERHATAPVGALLQVNLAEEGSKSGVAPAAVDSFVELACGFSKVAFRGLMTMPPLTDDPEDVRPHFAALRRLAERLGEEWSPRHDFSVLSMGTSQDFEAAVEEGATVVRLGSVLYA